LGVAPGGLGGHSPPPSPQVFPNPLFLNEFELRIAATSVVDYGRTPKTV
jgi:hypothetical protein